MEKGGENIKGLDKERGGCGRMRIARAGVVMAGLMVISGLMATPARGQAVVERREGLSRADLFELGLYTPPKATPSRCQPRIDEARMQEVAKGIQKAFFLEGKESERIARRWLLNNYGRKGSLGSALRSFFFGTPAYADPPTNCRPCAPDAICPNEPCCICGFSKCCQFTLNTDQPSPCGESCSGAGCCCLFKDCEGTNYDEYVCHCQQ